MTKYEFKIGDKVVAIRNDVKGVEGVISKMQTPSSKYLKITVTKANRRYGHVLNGNLRVLESEITLLQDNSSSSTAMEILLMTSV